MGDNLSIHKQAKFLQQNQLTKALNSSALFIIIFRLLFAVILAFMHYWSLAVYSLLGGLLWIWIYKMTKKGYQTPPLVLGILESILYCILATLKLGWNSGAYFSLISLLPVIMINGAARGKLRTFLCGSIVVFLAALFAVLQSLKTNVLVDPTFQCLFFILNLVQCCSILITVTYTIEKEKMLSEAEIVNANQRLLTLANTDPLTSLLNRRIMTTLIEEEKVKVDGDGPPFSLIMIDVDNFKQINDEYGHDGGDFVLVMLAEKLKLGVRKNDRISRWGGDEFLIMLVETDPENGKYVAEKIRSRVENTPFIYHEMSIPVTITLGISECDKFTGISGCLRNADLALYKGKQEGKNCSVLGSSHSG